MTAVNAISELSKNIVFSTRRTDRAVNSDNIVVSLGNADVASGQAKNALESAELLAKESKNSAMTGFKSAHDALKAISKENAFLEGAGKVIGFTADHINPVICVVSGGKVLTSDNKKETLTEEVPALGMMFAFEGAAKNMLEMDKKVKNSVTGEKESVKRVAFYKNNPILKANAERMENAIKDYCNTKKLFNKISLKHAPGILKGLAFVTASITGYELGSNIGKKINSNSQAA